MEKEIIVGFQSGNVTFSFKTDQEGSNLKEGFEAVNRLISSHKDLLQRAAAALPLLTKPIIHEQTIISLSQIGIPQEEKETILNQIDDVNRFDLFVLLLHYAKKSLSYDQIMSLSKELGKPIKYNWLDSEPHRPQRKGFIMSESIPGKKEKLYSLSERGKKKAESIVKALKEKESP
jgi:hypothetical protein